MKVLRLIMPAACDIYNMRLIEDDSNSNKVNNANYFACYCQNEKKFLQMIDDIKNILKKNCAKQFKPGNKYYYLTTSYASQIKNLKVTHDVNVNKDNNEYNYFDLESTAKQVLQSIIDIFYRYCQDDLPNKGIKIY